MSGFILKLIAMGSMVIDHLGYPFFFDNQVLRFIGRFAFIIYAFLIAEGYYHLKDKPDRLRVHAIKLFVLCVITEIPFDLFDHEKWINITTQSSLPTLMAGFLALVLSGYWKKRNRESQMAVAIGSVVIFVAFACFSLLIRSEYKFAGVLLIGMFYLYLCHADNKNLSKRFAALIVLIAVHICIYLWSRADFGNLQTVLTMAENIKLRLAGTFVSIIPLAFYNRKLGYHSKWFSWLYSCFYPLQFVVLIIARYFIRGF